MDKSGLSRQAMCDRLAAEFLDGWIVNLGAGLPTLCSGSPITDRTVFFHSENGVLGVGPRAERGHEDLHLINAANEYVTLIPGAAIMDHADSFALVRGGRLDATVLGAFEVACNGDFSNWKIAGRIGGAIGGAMDLAVGARRVFITMEHTTKSGQSRLRRQCELPITARGRMTLLMTNLGLFQPLGDRFLIREVASGWTLDEICARTDAPVEAAPDLREVAVAR
jgi:3-oxoacid CoA-transferase B subunit